MMRSSDTASTGTDNPLWCYADYRAPYVQRMAELLQPDVIKVSNFFFADCGSLLTQRRKG